MKTTIDIPEKALAEAMRFTGAKTKREAVVTALEDYNRRQRVGRFLIEAAGSMPNLPGNEEIETLEVEREESLRKLWKREGKS